MGSDHAGLPLPGLDHFGYTACLYVGDSDEEGWRIGGKLLWFLNTLLKPSPQISRFLPGRMPPRWHRPPVAPAQVAA